MMNTLSYRSSQLNNIVAVHRNFVESGTHAFADELFVEVWEKHLLRIFV